MKKIRLNKEFYELCLRGGDDELRIEAKSHWREVFKLLDCEFEGDGRNPEVLFAVGIWWPSLIGPDRQAEEYKHAFKIASTGEPYVPHPRRWDYRFSMAEDSDTNFHIVCCAFFQGFDEIVSGDFSREMLSHRETPKTRFCNFVYGLQYLQSSLRVPLFEKLSGYKRVDSPGKVCNNRPSFNGTTREYPAQQEMEKRDFLQHYKFTIAAENCSHPNYVSEKLLHPLLVGSVPIYWGSPRAARYFNPDSFINSHDFEDLDAVVEYVKRVDQDEALYQKYREAPAILPDSLCHRMTKKLVAGKLREVLERAQRRPCKPVSRRFVNRFVYLPLQSVKFRATSRWRVAKPAVQRKLTGSL